MVVRRRRGRHQPSTVDLLDKELRDLVQELLDQNVILDDIKAKLRELGTEVSRSALGRFALDYRKTSAVINEQRSLAKALSENVDPGDEGKLAEMNIELAHSALTTVQLAAMNGEGAQLDAKETMFFTSAIKNLVSAKAMLLDLRRKAREYWLKQALKAIDKVAADKSKGLTKETVDAIYHAVLGVQ